jgi:hypothetical protein
METDLIGTPFVKDGKMVWAPPKMIPLDPDANNIIFFDELTQATPSLQAAALQIILDRRIGEFVLPDNVVMVAAGNRASDKTGAKPLIKALANRFMHVTVEAKFKDWQTYAIKNGVHPDVVGFLSHKPHYLNTFDAGSPENAFATPRTWTYFVSDMLKTTHIPDDLLQDAISGCIGEAIAIEFMSLRKIMSDLPKPDDIISGKVKELRNKEIAAQYSLVVSVLYRMKEMYGEVTNKEIDIEDWYKGFDNYMGFALSNIEPEISVMGIAMAIKQFQLPMNHKKIPNYEQFFKKYAKLLKGVHSS